MGEVVEGVPTAAEVVLLAKKHNLKLPLFFACSAIISGKMGAMEALGALMATAPGEETFTMEVSEGKD